MILLFTYRNHSCSTTHWGHWSWEKHHGWGLMYCGQPCGCWHSDYRIPLNKTGTASSPQHCRKCHMLETYQYSVIQCCWLAVEENMLTLDQMFARIMHESPATLRSNAHRCMRWAVVLQRTAKVIPLQNCCENAAKSLLFCRAAL